ncbi:MAG: DUF3990 domain-containing protein [Fibromonadales bacterium]|nr:DUF3990 domain-containing protein [Fibromonadales bacterium]
MNLYHGSNTVIEIPDLKYSRKYVFKSDIALKQLKFIKAEFVK